MTQLETMVLNEWGCRVMQPQTLLAQMTANNGHKMLSWGLDIRVIGVADDEKDVYGVLFKMDNDIFNGFLLITLGFMDTYDIRFLDMNANVLAFDDDIYCDEITDRINGLLNSGFIGRTLETNPIANLLNGLSMN